MITLQHSKRVATDKKTEVHTVRIIQEETISWLLTKRIEVEGHGLNPTAALLSAFIDSDVNFISNDKFSIHDALEWVRERLDE